MTTINGFSASLIANSKPGPSEEELMAAAQAESKDAILSILGSGTGVSAQSLLFLLQKRISDVDKQIRALTARITDRTTEVKALQDRMTAMRAVQSALTSADKGDNVQLKDIQIGDQTAYEFIQERGLVEHFNYTSSSSAYDRAIGLAEANDGFLTTQMWEAEKDRVEIRRQTKRRKKRNQAAAFLQDVANNPLDFSNGRVSIEALRAGRARVSFKPEGKLNKHSVEQSIEKLQSEIQSMNSGNEMDMIELQSVMDQRSQIVRLVTNMIRSLQDAEKKIIENTR